MTFHTTSDYKQKHTEAKNNISECFFADGWMNVQSCDVSFDLLYLFSSCCTVNAKSD